jgi:hypothetical protein
MCTVTWCLKGDGYDVCFSRDELNCRTPESPPALGRIHETDYVAPRDGAFGGTWLLVNHHGVTICLLNDYEDPWQPSPAQPGLSRGDLPLACATASNADDAWGLLQREDLDRRLPFTLLVFTPNAHPARIRWRGGRARYEPALREDAPLSSSSWRPSEVIAARKAAYRQIVPETPTAADLRAFHFAHTPDRGAHSVLMRRPDAATRSFIHVGVTAKAVVVDYQPIAGSPPVGTARMLTRLARLAVRSPDDHLTAPSRE